MNDAGQCGANVDYTKPVVVDNCGLQAVPTQPVVLNSGEDVGSMFGVGTTLVLWTATDTGGRQETCTVNVTVVDGESPTISCPGDVVVGTGSGVCDAVVEYGTVVGEDNCPGAVTRMGGGGNFPSGATFGVGNTTVEYEVEDSVGLVSRCSFVVSVRDEESPEIQCPLDMNVSTSGCSQTVSFSNATGTDNCGSVEVVQSGGLVSGSAFPLGESSIEYTARDSSGNEARCTFVVRVSTTTAPTIGKYELW